MSGNRGIGGVSSRSVEAFQGHQSDFFTDLQCWILRRLSDGHHSNCDGAAFIGKSKLEVQLGREFWQKIAGRTVIDFGCGEGEQAIEMAGRGARWVYGVDIQQSRLEKARKAAGTLPNISFHLEAPERADLIMSLDSMEHFADPAAILQTFASLLNPGGSVIVCFGCPWFHPYGGHEFSIFPWAHLLFSEKALIGWRRLFHDDGATRFSEIDGGLNRMTIRRFRDLIAASPLRVISWYCRPIRHTARLHNRFTQEFLTSVVRCELTHPH